MRATFSLCQKASWPCIFHHFHTHSICQRTRSSTKASVKLSRGAGTLLMRKVHLAQSRCRCVIVVPCLRAYSSCLSCRRLTCSSLARATPSRHFTCLPGYQHNRILLFVLLGLSLQHRQDIHTLVCQPEYHAIL